MRALITAVGEEGAGREALQQVVERIRAEHRACRYATTVCNLGGCPWPWMFEEDVTALYEGLVAAGYSLEKRAL